MAKDEENEVLNEGKKQSQSEGDRSDEKADDLDLEELGDGRVALSREELEKLQSDRDNYREATLSLKEKMKSRETESEPEPESPPTSSDSGEVTKWDLAARDYFRENPEMKDYRDEMLAYYRRIDSEDTIDAKVSNLERAGRLYRMDNPAKFENGEGDEDDEARADLSSESGEPAGKSRRSKKESGGEGERKVLPERGTSPDQWYGDEEE